MNKKQSQQRHFATRCLQRIGFVLDSDEIIKDIQSQKLKPLKKQSNRVTHFLYESHDKEYVVVYDKMRKNIVTIFEYGKED